MQDGKLLFAKYAFRPNQLGYCGGPDSDGLLEYVIEGESDAGLDALIRKFEAAYPYLRFIANSNSIEDATDPRVVQAYWLGNELLDRVDMKAYYDFVQDRFAPRIPKRLQKYVLGKVPEGALPHHSFHVLDVSMRTGALAEHIDSLDRCRISWGKVVDLSVDTADIEYSPLVIIEGRLALGEPVRRTVSVSASGRGYHSGLKVGDLVTVHWDWICDVVQPQQAHRLEALTRFHIKLANQTQ